MVKVACWDKKLLIFKGKVYFFLVGGSTILLAFQFDISRCDRIVFLTSFVRQSEDKNLRKMSLFFCTNTLYLCLKVSAVTLGYNKLSSDEEKIIFGCLEHFLILFLDKNKQNLILTIKNIVIISIF
jgi:hypothetical protein